MGLILELSLRQDTVPLTFTVTTLARKVADRRLHINKDRQHVKPPIR